MMHCISFELSITAQIFSDFFIRPVVEVREAQYARTRCKNPAKPTWRSKVRDTGSLALRGPYALRDARYCSLHPAWRQTNRLMEAHSTC
jgi:hypothetical protein